MQGERVGREVAAERHLKEMRVQVGDRKRLQVRGKRVVGSVVRVL